MRVRLHGRRVRAWVVAEACSVPAGVEAQSVIEVVSLGPPPEVVELCRWGAWRWAGRLRPFLAAASPDRVVRRLGDGAPAAPARGQPSAGQARAPDALASAVTEALSRGDCVLRVPPSFERQPIVEAALSSGPPGTALVLVESRADAEQLSGRLRRSGRRVATYPEQWAAASVPGGVVVGTRNASLSPLAPSLTIVLDAHAESYRSERVPSFDARELAAERARRSGSPVVFVTPCPPVELLAPENRSLVLLPRSLERSGWARIGVFDSRDEDPAEGGYPSQLVSLVRQAARAKGSRPVVCILDRTGRARLLSCALCGTVQRCGRCGAAEAQEDGPAEGELGRYSCPRCRSSRPAVCLECGSSRSRVLRSGVTRAREQLEAVTGLRVAELSGRAAPGPAVGGEPPEVVIGTQAALHRLRSASLVVFLDFDQKLLAPRFRAAEEALALLARSIRMVRERSDRPAVVVRTSIPDHEVIRAARLGDPGIVAAAELERRELLSLPPFAALARVTGEAAGELVGRLGAPLAATASGEGEYVVSAPSPGELAAGLSSLVEGEPGGYAALKARVEVDPIDL